MTQESGREMTIGELARRIERQSKALESLLERMASATLPLVMSKVRAAKELDMSVTTLGRLIRRGEIKLTAQGKVPASELLRYAAVPGRNAPTIKKSKNQTQAAADRLEKWAVP
jgi:hypothetical protein